MSDVERSSGRVVKWLELYFRNETPEWKILRRTKLIADALFEGSEIDDRDIQHFGTIVMTTVGITAERKQRPTEQMSLRERRLKTFVDAHDPVIEDF